MILFNRLDLDGIPRTLSESKVFVTTISRRERINHESPAQSENRIKPRVYVRRNRRSTMFEKLHFVSRCPSLPCPLDSLPPGGKLTAVGLPPGGKLSRDSLPPTLIIFTPGGNLSPGVKIMPSILRRLSLPPAHHKHK